MTIKSNNYKGLFAILATIILAGCMYTAPVDQGKAFSDKQIHTLKLHMSKAEVKKILGEPVIQHHSNQRWTYVDYHFAQHHQDRQQLILSFNQKDQLVRVETKGRHT